MRGNTTIRIRKQQAQKIHAIKILEGCDTVESTMDKLIGGWEQRRKKKKEGFEFSFF